MSRFKISTYLKNLIGQDLITNNVIAIFELVKNSYDADASQVNIIFDNNKLIIEDNGYGMNKDDIENKWLFLGYSSKADIVGGEIMEFKNSKNKKRGYAGSKGIGRFACDKLGGKLLMYSKKKDGEEQKLIIPRDKFEKNMTDEFVNIEVELNNSNDKRINNHGTIIEISLLRDNRTRKDYQKLKHHLMRLLSPIKNDDGFVIKMDIPSELENDKNEKNIRDVVNGIIENDALEKIIKYTVYLDVEYHQNIKHITLFDRGRKVFSLIKENILSEDFLGISMRIYYLNTTAKREFTKLMGIDNVSYGSIFLYKNNIRVYPFGESGDDSLGIDKRKQQGYARYLGTRDILGYIDVKDPDNKLREATNREGLLDNAGYRELERLILDEGFKVLEKYVVDALSWTEKRDENNQKEIAEIYKVEDKIELVKDFIRKQYNQDKSSKIEIGKEFEQIMTEKDILGTLEAKTKGTKIENDVRKVVEETKKVKHENIILNEKVSFLDQEVEASKEQSEKLIQNIGISEKKILTHIHDLGIIIGDMDAQVSMIFQKIAHQYGLESDFYKIFTYINKAKTLIDLCVHPEFQNIKKEINIYKFIHERAKIIIDGKKTERSKKIEYTDNYSSIMVNNIKVNTLDIQSILINLISNSIKAKATRIDIEFLEKIKGFLFHDNGAGIGKAHVKRIFEMGYTTTGGSGVGLYNVKKILEKYNSTIEIKEHNKLGGASFFISMN